MENGESEIKHSTCLKTILTQRQQSHTSEKQPPKQLSPSEWVEVRVYICSTFVETHSERDVLIRKVIPEVNRILKDRRIRVVPVDMRWGVVNDESVDAEYAIQTLLLNEIDNCRLDKNTYGTLSLI